MFSPFHFSILQNFYMLSSLDFEIWVSGLNVKMKHVEAPINKIEIKEWHEWRSRPFRFFLLNERNISERKMISLFEN